MEPQGDKIIKILDKGPHTQGPLPPPKPFIITCKACGVKWVQWTSEVAPSLTRCIKCSRGPLEYERAEQVEGDIEGEANE